MKWIILVSFLLLSCFSSTTPVFADTSYARLNVDAYLYKTSAVDKNNYGVWCQMESTYFVEIILDFNSTLYKVRYGSVVGYVKKEDVTPVYSTPKNPYPSNIQIKLNAPCYLRSTPTINAANTLTTLSKEESLPFIAKIDSEVVMDFNGPTWYLVSYQDVMGYVYAGYTEKLGTIMPNLEQVSLSMPTTSDIGITPFNNIQSLWLVVLALIPTFGIIFLLYKPKKEKKADSK